MRGGWAVIAFAALGGCSAPLTTRAVGSGDAGPPGSCSPGASRCLGQQYQVCGQGGTFIESDASDECQQQACAAGGCLTPCEQAEVDRSYVGCEYWPVDLDNAVEVLGAAGGGCDVGTAVELPVCQAAGELRGQCDFGGVCPSGFTCEVAPACILDAQHSPFAVVVSNPNEEAVEIVLSNAAGQTHRLVLQSGAVEAIFPQQLGFDDQSLDGSSISTSAYRLIASLPIVAYQFNPLDNVDVFSNDGSLLVPRHAYDTQYLALTLPTLARRPQTHDYSGYVTVVASAPGETELIVTPTAEVRAGEGVGPLAPGEPARFTLSQFQVLNLAGAAGGDLTGTRIESADGQTTFGVFVGHEADVLSDQAQPPCCADHVEEQLFPLSTWGQSYIIARSEGRGEGEPDMLRILAQRANTEVSFDPAPAQGTCPVLEPGAFCDVFIDVDTAVSSRQPILVGHLLLSTGGSPVMGDPALALAPPVEQFRTDYTFLVPQQYERQFISIVAPQDAGVALDGVDLTAELAPVGQTGFNAGRFPVEPGQRKLDCPRTCGVVVYGYSPAVSYLFAGGLDLQQIVDP